MITEMRPYEAEVAAGFAELEAANPGWWRADAKHPVNLNTLAMYRGDRCILGQACPFDWDAPMPYTTYLRILMPGDPHAADRWAAARGFTLAEDPDGEDRDAFHDQWKALADEWTHIIQQHRDEAQS